MFKLRHEYHHEHHVYYHSDPVVIQLLEAIMATIQDLQAAVARNTDAGDSVVILLKGISQQLKDAQANNDPAAVDAVIASLDANTAKYATAVTENTPSA